MKHITVKQVINEDDEVSYRVTKTVDTLRPTIGLVLTPREVEQYCMNRLFRVTVLPGE